MVTLFYRNPEHFIIPQRLALGHPDSASLDYTKGALQSTNAPAQLRKIMIFIITVAVTNEKASKKAKMRLVPSNLYRPRENCTLLQTFSFSYIGSQHLNFAALTSARPFGNSEAQPKRA
jgi:hypothetical protein